MLNIVIGALSQGVIWGVMVMGVYLTYRILDFPDLSCEGSLALGGAVCAISIVSGINPWISLILALIAGLLAGTLTGILNVKLEIPGILAGILTMISLYSINIEIMGRANTSLLGEANIFANLSTALGVSTNMAILIIGSILALLIVCAMKWLLGTDIGRLIRATGNNQTMVCSQGKNPKVFKIAAIALSNGLIALCGALICQQQGYADVAMGTGAIIIGLASIIIGEVIFGKKHGFFFKFLSVVLGSIVYRLIISFILYLGLKPTLLNLFTAIIVASSLSSPAIKKQMQKRRNSHVKA